MVKRASVQSTVGCYAENLERDGCRRGSGHKDMRGGVGKMGVGRKCQANCHAGGMS